MHLKAMRVTTGISNDYEMKELFVRVNRIGFCFYLDEGFKTNLMSPMFLSFFRKDSLSFGTTTSLFVNSMKDTKEAFPDPSDLMSSIAFEGVYKLMTKQIIRCRDNKFRRCQCVKFSFEYNGENYCEVFYVDPSLWNLSKVHVRLGSLFAKKLSSSIITF